MQLLERKIIKMYKIITIYFIISLVFNNWKTVSASKFVPFDKDTTVPQETPEPINVDLNQAINITTQTPFTFLTDFGKSKSLLINTGYSVEVVLNQRLTTERLIGGVLKHDYIYWKHRYFWTNDSDGIACTSVNNANGASLEVSVMYYNRKYCSVRNALNYKDGMAQILFRIYIGSVANPAFNNFARAMKKITTPRSCAGIGLVDAYSWYFVLPRTIKSFIYPGAYTNESNGDTYYCMTTVVSSFSPSTQYISRDQFANTFLKLIGINGEPLINQKRQYPRGGRPIYQNNLQPGIIERPSCRLVPSILGPMSAIKKPSK